MSNALYGVLFKDGTRKYSIYKGSIDRPILGLVDTREEAEQFWDGYGISEKSPDGFYESDGSGKHCKCGTYQVFNQEKLIENSGHSKTEFDGYYNFSFKDYLKDNNKIEGADGEEIVECFSLYGDFGFIALACKKCNNISLPGDGYNGEDFQGGITDEREEDLKAILFG